MRSFFNFYCLFRQRFSAAYLLKLFLLPQRVYTTLFIRCDKPELICWYLYSLHAGIQMSPDEVVGNCDGCRHPLPKANTCIWKLRPHMILAKAVTCPWISASMALFKVLVIIIFSVVKSMAVLAFNVFTLMSVSLSVTRRMKGQSLLTNQGFLINGRLFKMDFVPDKMRVNKSCCHPVAAMILVMYVDYNGIQHNCEELVKGFEKVVKIEGAWLCARSRLSSTTDRHLVLSPDGLGSQGKGCFVFPKKRNSLDFVGKLWFFN